MNSLLNTIPANPETPCHCCGRVHRKLFNVDGYLLGQNCADDYKLYQKNNDVTSIYWRGWERKHAKVAQMVRGR